MCVCSVPTQKKSILEMSGVGGYLRSVPPILLGGRQQISWLFSSLSTDSVGSRIHSIPFLCICLGNVNIFPSSMGNTYVTGPTVVVVVALVQ